MSSTAAAGSSDLLNEVNQVDRDDSSPVWAPAQEGYSVVGTPDEESLATEKPHGSVPSVTVTPAPDQLSMSVTSAAPEPKHRGDDESQETSSGLLAQPSPEETLITPDAGVLKVILKQGDGELPPLHAQCLGMRPPDITPPPSLPVLDPSPVDLCTSVLGTAAHSSAS